MPKPNHRARSAAAAGGGGGGPIDADWKYFLDNVREEGHSYAVRVPADGANPSYYLQYEKPLANGAASTSSRGGAARKRRRMEEEEESSSGEPASGPNIEEDYRVFLQNVRLVGHGGFVLELEGSVIRYDASGAALSSDESSDESVMGAPEPNPRRRKVCQLVLLSIFLFTVVVRVSDIHVCLLLGENCGGGSRGGGGCEE